MFLVDIIENDLDSARRQKDLEKQEKKEGCSCGRQVCCGKHKNSQCACHQKGRGRD